jgi:DNA-binding response OmpR family regulator
MAAKALVVDNDFFFVEFVSEQLQEREYQVIKAYNAKEAIANLSQEDFEIVFVDTIMPEVGGKDLIRFIRSRSPDASFAVVAMPIVEELDSIRQIAADYYVIKGPVEEMAQHIQLVIDRVRQGETSPQGDNTVFQTEGLVPRGASNDLIKIVSYQQAILESLGAGLLVLDYKTTIVKVNLLALEVINKPYDEILNRPVVSVFGRGDRTRIAEALKKLLREPETRNVFVSATLDSRKVGIYCAALRMDARVQGWTMVMNGWSDEIPTRVQ